jgi:hypothetical protein
MLHVSFGANLCISPHEIFILALFITLGCGPAFAQTTVSANALEGSPSFVDSTPRPTFYFSLAPAYRGFTSFLLTWGTGSTKDGIVVKPSIYGSYIITDIFKTGNVVTVDSHNDIYATSYSPNDGRLSFIRSWDTGDSKNDVPLKKSEPNSFQWEVLVNNTLYVGSYSRPFVQIKALLKTRGRTVRTVLPPKPRIENFAENFRLRLSTSASHPGDRPVAIDQVKSSQ